MKKILAMMLTAAMMLSMGTAAMAADEWNGKYASSDTDTFTITKTYTSDVPFIPEEDLVFTVTVTEGKTNPDTEMLTVADELNTYTIENTKATATETEGVYSVTNNITVHVPSYDTAGTYYYTIKETATGTAGVTYDTDKSIYVQVLVEYDNVHHKLVIGNPEVIDVDEEGNPKTDEEGNVVTKDGIYYYIVKDATGEKDNNITNDFATGEFTVAKDVRGNMANETDTFEITVTLTSAKPVLTAIEVAGQTVAADKWVPSISDESTTWEYKEVLTISENSGEITFTNVPVGVSVKVEETDTTLGEYELTGYEVDAGEATKTVPTFTVEDDVAKDVVVVNTNTSEVATGISVDSIPYIAMLGVVAIGGTGFIVSKKRRSED